VGFEDFPGDLPGHGLPLQDVDSCRRAGTGPKTSYLFGVFLSRKSEVFDPGEDDVLLDGGCGLTVSRIALLNPDAEEFRAVPPGWIPRHGGVDERREATASLRRHFRRMGFERFRGTRLHSLSMSQIVPTLEDLLRPKR
jgi:hypothetical protein